MPLYIQHLHGARRAVSPRFSQSLAVVRRREQSATIPAKPILERSTVSGALGRKFVSYVEQTPFVTLAVRFGELSAVLAISAVLISPVTGGLIVLAVLSAGSWAIPKLAAAGLAVAYRREIFTLCRKFARRASERYAPSGEIPDENERQLDGIPVVELADYLVRNGDFKREGKNGARETFGLRMERYQKIAGNLENAGVLVRGENNARILSEEWTRQTLVDFLGQSEDSDHLRDYFRINAPADANVKVRLSKEELAVAE